MSRYEDVSGRENEKPKLSDSENENPLCTAPYLAINQAVVPEGCTASEQNMHVRNVSVISLPVPLPMQLLPGMDTGTTAQGDS